MKSFNLEKEPKIESGFKVPDSYFEDFQNKMLKQIPERKVPVYSLFTSKRIRILSTAAVLILFFSVSTTQYYNTSKQHIETLALENYLADQTLLCDDLVYAFSSEEIEKMKTKIPINNNDIEDILSNEDNLELYLTN